MEENQNTESQESSNGVSFPSVSEPKKSGGAKTFLIIGILILVAILGFVIYKSANKNTGDESATPTAFDNLTTPSDELIQTVTPAPSATASAASVDKSKIQIQVQNGTGITGEAAYLQSQLAAIGYTNVKTGNSDTTVTATTVTFLSTLDAAVVSEITQKLNSIYQTVTVKTSTSATFDVAVVVGLRKGATSRPNSTAAPSATGTGSPTASRSPSPTPSRSPSPTP